MKTRFLTSIGAAFCLGSALISTARESLTDAEIAQLRLDAAQAIVTLPDTMPGAEKDNPALVKLGERLYFEKRLSVNNSMSCNTCHRVDDNLGGVDNEPTSPGAFGTLLSQNTWLPVLRTLQADAWAGGRLMVPKANTLMDAQGRLADEATRARLAKFIGDFAAFTVRHDDRTSATGTG